jgi:chromosome segregation ATPase
MTENWEEKYYVAEATITELNETIETMVNAVNSHKEVIAELEGKLDLAWIDYSMMRDEIEELKLKISELEKK